MTTTTTYNTAIDIGALVRARNEALPAVLPEDASASDIMQSGKDAIVFGKTSARLCAGIIREAIRQALENDEDAGEYVIAAFQSAYFKHGQKSDASAFTNAVLNAGISAQAGKAKDKAPADRTPFEGALVHCFRDHRVIYNGREKRFMLRKHDATESAASIAARQLSAIAGIAGVGKWEDIVEGIKSVIASHRDAADTAPLIEKIEKLEAANKRMAEALKKSAGAAKKSATTRQRRASAGA